MDRTAYKNRHIKEHYDRINLVIPKGEKDRIKGVCSEMGASVNEYLYMLVCNDLANGTSRMAAKKQRFSVEQERMLEKWQVPRKYYEMIEDLSYTKDEGYFIYLKKGYVNDVTGSRNIHLRGISVEIGTIQHILILTLKHYMHCHMQKRLLRRV